MRTAPLKYVFTIPYLRSTMTSKPLIRFLLPITSLMFVMQLSAQDAGNPKKSNSAWTEHIYTGGNFGLQFGTQTVIDINPIVGYRFTPKLSSGIGIKYLYYRYKDTRYNYSYESNTYGGSVFARYEIMDGIFAYSEYELLNLQVYDYAVRQERRVDIGSWFAGAGYSQRIGDRSSIYIMILYNLTESRYTPYDNPIFRMGFGIGI